MTTEQFDGEFIHIGAADIRHHDVILGDARTVTAPPVTTTDGRITATTTGGAVRFAATAIVYVFRPAAGTTDEPCPDCGAAPGEPCAPHCLSYAALDDAAGTGIA